MYYIVFGFLYLISLLPFFLLYGIADFFFVIIYYVIRYRRQVVMNNLRNSFPEKTELELKRISRRFYRNFIDNWIETIKLISISKKTLSKRTSGNFEILFQLYASGKPIQGNFGHFFNWELMTLYTGIQQPFTFLTVYFPQENKVFDRLLHYIRARWGNPLLPSTDMVKSIIPWRKKQYMLSLGADQNPPNPVTGFWMYFLNQPTVFLRGPEKYARIQNIPVVMMTTTKPRRGHYNFNYFLLTEDPESLSDGELIRRYVRHLEENIRLQPEIYLWSHKRWKHSWKPEYEKLWVDNKPMPGKESNN